MSMYDDSPEPEPITETLAVADETPTTPTRRLTVMTETQQHPEPSRVIESPYKQKRPHKVSIHNLVNYEPGELIAD
jgi:hypothetical protein